MAYYPYAPSDSDLYVLSTGLGPPAASASFNNSTDPWWVGMLTSVTGLDSADVRDGGDINVQSDGGYSSSQFYGRRPITLNGQVYGHASIQARNVKLAMLRQASNIMTADGNLMWTPPWGVTNYISNGDFEGAAAYFIGGSTAAWSSAALAGYVTAGATQSWDSVFYSGAHSMKVVTPATIYTGAWTSLAGGQAAGPPNTQPLPAGTYTFGAWLKGAAGGEAVQLRAGPSGGTPTTSNITLTNSWAYYSMNFTSDGVTLSVAAIVNRTATAITFNADQVSVMAAGSGLSYFDGNTAGYWWSGNPANGWSSNFVPMFCSVRQQLPLRITGSWTKTFQVQLVSAVAPIQGLFPTLSGTVTATGGTNSPYAVVENYGDYPVQPTVILYGPTGNTGAQIVYFGKAYSVNFVTGFSIAAGETVTVNCATHTASSNTRGDVTQYLDLVNSVWEPIVPGLNYRTVSYGSMVVSSQHAWR